MCGSGWQAEKTSKMLKLWKYRHNTKNKKNRKNTNNNRSGREVGENPLTAHTPGETPVSMTQSMTGWIFRNQWQIREMKWPVWTTPPRSCKLSLKYEMNQKREGMIKSWKYEKYYHNAKIWKIIKTQKNIENIGREWGLWKPPRYPMPDATPNSVQFQTLALSLYYSNLSLIAEG